MSVGRVLLAISFANKQIGGWREDISHCVRPETWVLHRTGHMGNTFRTGACSISTLNGALAPSNELR